MQDRDGLDELLRKSECLSCLDAESLDLVKQQMVPVSCEPQEDLFREGQGGDCMYVIESGEFSVIKQAEDGTPVEVAVLGPGELIGEMSLFDASPRSATVRSRQGGRLWRLDRRNFQRLLEGNPRMAGALLASMGRRLREETREIAKLRSGRIDRRLKIAFFDSKPYTERAFTEVNDDRFAMKFFQPRLTSDTISLAAGFRVICAFVNDDLGAASVEELKRLGVELIAMRCAGYNNVDLAACDKQHISVVRVPAYSPCAVAEHATALMMALNRHIHRAHARVREGNFSLNGLVGFDMCGKPAGVIGTGRIGKCAVDILLGFGCNVLAHDLLPNEQLVGREAFSYVPLDELFRRSDIITLHVPLTPRTHHIINAQAIAKMKTGIMLINTSRGGLVDTKALIDALKTGKVGSAGLDVYEEESEYFFEDFSDNVIADDVLARLLTFNNVMITSHQGFLTAEALTNIARTTLDSVIEWRQGKRGTELTYGVCPKCE